MKISTRIILGFTVLMLLAIVALAYQVSVIHHMQSINQDLSSINFRSATILLQILYELKVEVEDFSKKYFVSPAYYAPLLDSAHQRFEIQFADLQQTVHAEGERAEVAELWKFWEDYTAAFARYESLARESLARTGEAAPFPEELEAALDRLDAQATVVYDTIQLSIRGQVARAAHAGEAARRFSWTTGIVSLVLGAGIVAVSLNAINTPLRQLTKGTRLIAKGKFWHRLPADGADEFSELARDFNAMSQRLGELDQMKKDFVSHVSHELKAPLAAIRQMVHLMIQEIPGPLNEQQKRLLRLSYSSGERLAAMVSNLLDVSRMEAGTMEYEISPHDLTEVVQAVAQEFQLQAREKNMRIRLEFDDRGVPVECDRDRIIQVIGNLFENALKFSPEGGEIVAHVQELEKGRERRAQVSVADLGPGVPDAHKDRIFRKFHQIKQGKKVAGQGVGLGLAICKTIVEAHGGEIWVEDNPGGGSLFCFMLKAANKTKNKTEALRCP